MSLNKAEQLLDKFACDLAKTLGFNRIESDFYGRPEHDAIAKISFPCRLSKQGNYLFTVWVGLMFGCLAKWLDFDNEGRCTIAQPIHFLREDTTCTEWEFSNENDLNKLRSKILNDLKLHALPYIERYSRIIELRKALESSNKQDWLSTGLNVDSRITVLAAIQFVQDERDNAIKTLDEGLKNLEETLAGRYHELRKRRFAMKYLRGRLLEEKEGTK